MAYVAQHRGSTASMINLSSHCGYPVYYSFHRYGHRPVSPVEMVSIVRESIYRAGEPLNAKAPGRGRSGLSPPALIDTIHGTRTARGTGGLGGLQRGIVSRSVPVQRDFAGTSLRMTVPVLGEFCGFHQRPGSGVGLKTRSAAAASSAVSSATGSRRRSP